jgi:hypothetical protein
MVSIVAISSQKFDFVSSRVNAIDHRWAMTTVAKPAARTQPCEPSRRAQQDVHR